MRFVFELLVNARKSEDGFTLVEYGIMLNLGIIYLEKTLIGF
jgi:hypothetical protein